MHFPANEHSFLPMPEKPLILRVTLDAERQLCAGHPWVYDRAIRSQSRAGTPGELAVVFDHRRKFLAIGLYDPTSPIRVRVLQHRRPAPIDAAWWRRRVTAAVQARAPLEADATTGYRLIHGENDGLPGLVADRYGQTQVIKLYTVAWVSHLRAVIDALSAAAPAKRLVLRLSRAVQQQPERLDGLTDGMVLRGAAITQPVLFSEHGLRFEADPVHGQKTGFFLDQRDNRARVERLAHGCTVLDACAYTGGFSVYAARGGAREVTSLDINAAALAAAKRNMARNTGHPMVAAARHQVVQGELFETLKAWRGHRKFDLVVLDPPAFATTRAEVPAALLAYARLTRAALGVLQSGGALVFACCAGQVGAEPFFKAVHAAATAVRQPLRELERTGQPLDHPISFSEGAYLKCLFARRAARVVQ
jgi:23S rRNA (cytosine1962-C5)-methyltransferase